MIRWIRRRIAAKILVTLAAILLVTCTGFGIWGYYNSHREIEATAKSEAQSMLARSAEMFMVSTRKFHDQFEAASTPEDKHRIVDDWSRSIEAVDQAVIHDFGEGATRVRLIGDAKEFDLPPLGKQEDIGIRSDFERAAAAEIMNGAPAHEELADGIYRIAVPLTADTHPGCAECHYASIHGLDHDFSQPAVFGTLNAYVPIQAKLDAADSAMMWAVIAILGVCAAIGVVIYVFLQANVLTPLARGLEFAHELKDGDLTHRLTLDREDEIGRLSTALDEVADSIENKVTHAQAIAAGDLTREVEIVSDRDQFGQALAQMLHNLRGLVGEISQTAEYVALKSDQVNSESRGLSQSVSEQAASVEEISSSLLEIGSQATSNSEHAGAAHELVDMAAHAASAGQDKMNGMVTAMDRITANSDKITNIVRNVDDIAFQTNLLALNAAVEAARAGQHGKGFAVVAEEVRNLASRSAKAAQETADLIAGNNHEIVAGAEIAQNTAEELNAIAEHIGKATSLVAEIAESSSNQTSSLNQINQGVSEIGQITQNNAVSAEQATAGSKDLTHRAGQLHSLIGRFRLNTDQNASEMRSVTFTEEATLDSATALHAEAASAVSTR